MSGRSRWAALFSGVRLPLLMLAAYWIALFVANHIPLPKVEYPVGNDKTAHLAAYAGLAFLFTWTMFLTRQVNLLGAVYAWFCVASYGVLDEYLQRFVVGRTPDLRDWVADALGAALGVAAFAAAQRLAERFFRERGGDVLESLR